MIKKHIKKKEKILDMDIFGNFENDETLELLEEIIIKVKDADREVENSNYDPMLECGKYILDNYQIKRR